MREVIFDRLISSQHRKAFGRPHIVKAMIELTYGCNLRCVHCYNPTHQAKGEISTQETFHILDQLVEQGCIWVAFTGGELFTRKDVWEVLWHAKRLGLIVSILSNATRITPELADEIEKLEPFQVDISVYGASEETYQKVTGIPGSLQRFLKGVDLLNERRVQMLLKLVVMTLNLHDLDQMREIAVSRRIRFQFSTDIYPRVDGLKDPLAYRLTPEQAFEVWQRFHPEGSHSNADLEERVDVMEEGCNNREKGIFDCGCGKSSVAVTPYGKMNLCLSIYEPQYDLREGSVAEGWETLVNFVKMFCPGSEYECGNCHLYSLCNRQAGNGWLEQRVFDGGCIPHYRDLAERKSASRLKKIELEV